MTEILMKRISNNQIINEVLDTHGYDISSFLRLQSYCYYIQNNAGCFVNIPVGWIY